MNSEASAIHQAFYVSRRTYTHLLQCRTKVHVADDNLIHWIQAHDSSGGAASAMGLQFAGSYCRNNLFQRRLHRWPAAQEGAAPTEFLKGMKRKT